VYFIALAYFVFKLVRMYTADTQRLSDYAPARKTLTVFAVITIMFLVVTILVACWCTHNFNKGLKPHVSKSAKIKEEGMSSNKMYMNDVGPERAHTYTDSHGGGVYGGPGPQVGGGSRMEID
jgi:hypothetical protein